MENNNIVYSTKNFKKNNHPHAVVWHKYEELYLNKFGIIPEINYARVGRLIDLRLQQHSIDGLIRILELFFEKEKNIAYDLQTVFSAFFINKYLPELKLNPDIYSNAEEWNKKVY